MQISNNDRCFMDLAVRVAEQSSCKFLHGAVIVSGGKPLITAPNIPKLIPFSYRYRQAIRANYSREAAKRRERSDSTHAETHAIIRAAMDLKGTTLYSARVTRSGDRRNSCPCPSCWQMILIAGIKTVLWFDDNGTILKGRV